MPHGYITRAEAATLLARTMLESDYSRSATAQFSDVDSNAWYYGYISDALGGGLVKGFPDGSFRPDNPITRQEFAALLARTAEHKASGSLPYTDREEISSWAYDYVYTAFITGLMHGDTKGTFRPHDPITRAEATAGICRILKRGETTARSLYGVDNVTTFPDVSDAGAWYFYYVVEAANSHWHVMHNNEEVWTTIVK